MNRMEFIDRLKIHLQGLPESEIQDILSDYEEHFDIGISKGKSEEEIASELGNPRDIANSYRTSYSNAYSNNPKSNNYNTSNDGIRKALIIAMLLVFNVIVVFGPSMAIFGLIIGLYGTALGLIIGGIGLLLGMPLVFFNFIPQFHIMTTLSFSIGLGALGVLIFILAILLTKFVYKMVVKYVKWNIDLINR